MGRGRRRRGQFDVHAVPEFGSRSRHGPPGVREYGEQRLPAEAAEDHHGAHGRCEEGQFGRRASVGSGRVRLGVGLLSGGAQCTGAVIRTPSRRRPSSRWVAVGWLARPTACSAAYSHSPLRSPVNMRPVRLAAVRGRRQADDQQPGASVAEAGTGRPQ